VLGAVSSVLLIAPCPASSAPARVRVRERCDRVVSYFLYPYQGSRLQQYQWRIFDPDRGLDRLFLSLPDDGGFGGVRWDTTFSNVFFRSGDSLFRAPWRWGARPKLITRLPKSHGEESWWFNPDSACWQMIRILGETEADHPYYSRYFGELWQSSRDGSNWRRVKIDSLDCEDETCEQWRWSDGTLLGRQAPAVTPEDLAGETRHEAWEGRIAKVDSSKVILVKAMTLTPSGTSCDLSVLRDTTLPSA
jgi:hypothetical protein